MMQRSGLRLSQREGGELFLNEKSCRKRFVIKATQGGSSLFYGPGKLQLEPGTEPPSPPPTTPTHLPLPTPSTKKRHVSALSGVILTLQEENPRNNFAYCTFQNKIHINASALQQDIPMKKSNKVHELIQCILIKLCLFVLYCTKKIRLSGL